MKKMLMGFILFISGCATYDGPYDSYYPNLVKPFNESGKAAIVISGTHFYTGRYGKSQANALDAPVVVFDRYGANTTERLGVKVRLWEEGVIVFVDPGVYALSSLSVNQKFGGGHFSVRKDDLWNKNGEPNGPGFKVGSGDVVYLGGLDIKKVSTSGKLYFFVVDVKDEFNESTMNFKHLDSHWGSVVDNITQKQIMTFDNNKW